MKPTLKDLGSEILLVEHLLEPSLCAHVIQVAECCQFSAPGNPVNVFDTEVRDASILPLDRGGNLAVSTNQLLLKQIKAIQDLLAKHYGVNFAHTEMCSILRYLPGQRYKRHVDNLLLPSRFVEVANDIPTRDVSIVGFLNQDFEGGELLFDRQNVKVTPQLGSAIVFPAYYTHPYQDLPVLRGKKYSFTSWLFY